MEIPVFDICETYSDNALVEFNSELFTYVPKPEGEISIGIYPTEHPNWFSINDIIEFLKTNYSKLNQLK